MPSMAPYGCSTHASGTIVCKHRWSASSALGGAFRSQWDEDTGALLQDIARRARERKEPNA